MNCDIPAPALTFLGGSEVLGVRHGGLQPAARPWRTGRAQRLRVDNFLAGIVMESSRNEKKTGEEKSLGSQGESHKEKHNP